MENVQLFSPRCLQEVFRSTEGLRETKRCIAQRGKSGEYEGKAKVARKKKKKSDKKRMAKEETGEKVKVVT